MDFAGADCLLQVVLVSKADEEAVELPREKGSEFRFTPPLKRLKTISCFLFKLNSVSSVRWFGYGKTSFANDQSNFR